MQTKLLPLILLILNLSLACQASIPPDITAGVDNEFILAPGQSADVTDADLTLTFHSVVGDDRCPSEVECAASGPVTVSLSIQQGNEMPTDVTLQTFTDQNGRSSVVEFEGVTNHIEIGEYQVQILGVTPYPQDPAIQMDPADYQLTLLVTNK